MNKYILIFFSFIVVSTALKAQDSTKVTYGIKLGINTNSTTRSSSLGEVNPPKMKGLKSYSITVVVDIPLTAALSVQPAVEFTKKGQVKKPYNSDSEQKSKVNYIQLPVDLVYKYKNIFVGAGGYASVALSGTYEAGSAKQDMKFGSTYVSATSKQNDNWEKYDYGLNTYLGYKIKKFTISINYEIGLKDIDPNPYYKSKNRVGSLDVGFSF